jgi:tetratricopeptide (TPR) repeat protein
VTPSQQVRVGDIRRAYLHFLIDPLMSRAKDNIDHKRPLCNLALDAPALSEIYKEDCVLLFGMSMVRAVEARLDKAPAQVDEAMKEGFVVTGAFYDALTGYEKQEASMRFALKEMVDALNTRRESHRVEATPFATSVPERKVTPAPAAAADPAETELESAEQRIKARDLDGARTICRALIERNAAQPVQARAYFGLARIAALENDAALSRELFEKTLTLNPEPFEKAWAHVYLARLAMATREDDGPSGGTDRAIQHYAAALAVEGASEQAHAAAQKEIEAAQRRKQQNERGVQ